MRPRFFLISLLFAAILITGSFSARAADEMNFEAQLIWGTNDTNPPPKLKLVGPNLEGKLKKSPFKWERYYEVRREKFSVRRNKEKAVTMSGSCEIRVTNLGADEIKLEIVGRGESAGTVTQKLPRKELLITGGNSPNSTAWFIVLRQTE